jgi:hypothetical protein
MRVISQNGKSDLPYENLAIFVEYENVIARFENERHLLAQYSSKAKAIKAMEMLRETYAGMPIMMQNVELTKEEIKAIERIKKDGIMVRLVDEPSKVECFNNIIFQFPQDSEMEVSK